MAMTTVDVTRPVTGGVDTHLDVNVAAALDPIGGLLGVAEFPTTPAGYRELAGYHTAPHLPCAAERWSGQVDTNGSPTGLREVVDLGAETAPEVEGHARDTEPAVFLGRNELGGRYGEVPPSVDAVKVRVAH